ncbi:MAG: anti-sigma factor family protein [Balneolaceae bacterium]
MSKWDTETVRYIFDELDPAERIEFERAISRDKNLLIEVESLRKIWQRMESLPHSHPPPDVAGAVLLQAASRQRLRTQNRRLWMRTVATLTVAASFSAAVFFYGGSSEPAGPGSIAADEPPAMQQPEPWVDQNDILYFNGRSFNQEAASLQSAYQTSFDKLEPVSPSADPERSRSGLHLTGSQN